MKHVLIVDDEKPFLLSVRDGLSGDSDKYQVHLAHNGEEALTTLHSRSIDLVVTDLKMPVMDGFQLLVAMSREFPHLPVIVMTAFGTPDIEARLKKAAPFHYLEKPLDLIALSEAIDQGLESSGRSLIRGITLATFLQLVQLENKTCTLKIKTPQNHGYLYIQQGNLIDAEAQDFRGEEAVYQIVSWKDPEIEMEPCCLRKEKKITSSVEHMLLEACRREDENNQELTTSAAQTVSPEDFSDITETLTEAADETTAAPAPTQTKPTLSTTLNDSVEVETYALFNEQGYLLEQHPMAGELMKLAPTIVLSAAANIGVRLSRPLTYIEFTTDDNQRLILCQLNEIILVIQLRSGGQPASLLSKLYTLGSQSAA